MSRAQSGKKSSASVKNNNEVSDKSRPGTSDLLSREEEYKKLNAELEAKTANLVKEAEEVLRDQENILSKSRLLDNINTDEFLKEFDDDLAGPNEDNGSATKKSARPLSSTKTTNQSRPQSKTKKPASAKPRSKSGKLNAADDVAVPDEAFLTELRDFSLQHAINNIEGQLEQGNIPDDQDDDVLPQGATDMGAEATIRFLKAKLRVMQEELDRLAQECTKKDEENSTLTAKLKEMEDERGRLYRTNATQQSQIEKFKKIAEDSQGKSDSLENQLSGLRKELDQINRSQKQQLTSQNATEVRLNRALEEIERYKDQVQKAKSTSKETTDQEKKRVELLLAENKRLEKQKNELMAGFKKQLKLIDILKRQKMHVEAAKMLSFSEEEFVKALEWGS
ncbi:hypothetical protein CHS0354_034069 [Potamilus streckersoni]|uniref:Testis-expressed sequence 9 protein n=1 Tax=Potamilus streckersoni TaxID=2493646 RepID=A0AAE0RV53_9BIVA|nr:hypothetical protein CHS0354_034069 [Potamilus streckersoni]